MRAALTFICAAALAGLAPVAAVAQPVEPIDDLQWLAIENIVAPVLNPDGECNGEALALVERARTRLLQGNYAEARRLYSQARAVFSGGEWTPQAEFVASLALRPAHVAVDPARKLTLAIGQHFPASYPASAEYRDISFRIHARRWSRRPAAQLDNAIALVELPMSVPDLLDNPQYLLLDLEAVPDGSWELVAEVLHGEEVIGLSASRIFVARDLERDSERLRLGLAALPDLRPGLAASIAYPLDLAQGLDRRDRKVQDIDLRAELDAALALLDAAEQGDDPQWQSRGQTGRHYFSEVSGRIEPFQVYIPESWDGATPLPLAVLLHGSMGDDRTVFADGRLEQAARERGIAILSPMGDDPNSVWGNRRPAVLADGSIPAPRPVIAGGRVQPVQRLEQEPAEADVQATLALMRAEFPIDPSRIYLGGNSMGGEGTLHLAMKWPETWAAIAPGAGPIDPDLLDYEVLARFPALVVHGSQDTIMSLAASRETVRRLQEAGGDAALFSPDDGHGAFGHNYETILDFFLRHRRPADD